MPSGWEEIFSRVDTLYKKVQKQNTLIDEMFPTQNYLHGVIGDYRQTTSQLEKELLEIRGLIRELTSAGEDSNDMARLFEQVSILHRPKFFDSEGQDITIRKTSTPDYKWSDSITLYQQFQKELEKNAEEWEHQIVGAPFQDFGLEMVFKDDNTFNKKALRYSFETIGNSAKETRRYFLNCLGEVFLCDPEEMMGQYREILRDIEGLIISDYKAYRNNVIQHVRLLPPLSEFSALKSGSKGRLEEVEKRKYQLKNKLLENGKWGDNLKELADYLFSLDTFNLYDVYRVDHIGRIYALEDYPRHNFDEIIGYEEQKSKLKDETAAFLAGKNTNNIYLYGPPGTGKSTTVNCLLTEFRDLRFVVLDKHQARLLSVVYDQIKTINYKCIIFFDELSYDPRDPSYKILQEAMEGAVNSLPKNVRIYAVANSPNPVKTGGQRKGVEIPDDLMALGDRFGIKISYPPPDRETQKKIMAYYLQQAGITKDMEESMAEFAGWCKENAHYKPNGRNIRDYVRTIRSEEERTIYFP